ncbi:hypothetical protein [Microbacterium sp. B35-04]|uniref:hypothetical protein n=1 Tax=Microbacterium sp. B35-04 TaxID=1961716 RepID=UPI0013D62479|nr:hypothetical protein [Microbacterium sp. B35-04]
MHSGIDTTPGINIADGATNWRADNSSGALRFLEAGVHQVTGLDFNGNLDVERDASGTGQIRARSILIAEELVQRADHDQPGPGDGLRERRGEDPVYIQGVAAQTADLTRR